MARSRFQFVVSVVCGIGAVLLVWPGLVVSLFSWSAHLGVALVGFLLGASLMLNTGKQYKPKTPHKEPSIAKVVLTQIMENRSAASSPQRGVVISRNLDLAIEELLDFIIRDYVLSWYNDLGRDQEHFIPILKADMWAVLQNVSSRLAKIDPVQFLAQDVVNKMTIHYSNIRYTCARPKCDEPRPKFLLHPWLLNPDTESDFLRKMTESLVIFLFPDKYSHCAPARHLLREILTCLVLKPTVDMLCDPDYINQLLLGWLDYREKLAEEHKRTYTYAATYEDFMKMIEDCYDIEHLKQIRYNIMTEIMHSTTINNLKKAKGIDTDKEMSPQGKTKGDLLKARNLRRYINQLTLAKGRCEKRIHRLGGPDYKAYDEDSITENKETHTIPGRKVLSFSVIMSNASGRKYLMQYLKRENSHSLLGFWIAVEKMRLTDKKYRHQAASEIYQMYISSASSAVKLDKTVIRGMEAFMMGNDGPEAFFQGQNQVHQQLEEQHYPSFIVSDVYHRYIRSMEEGTIPVSKDDLFIEHRTRQRSRQSMSEDDSFIAEQSSYAQQKLKMIDERLMNKSQALKALQTSQRDTRRKKIQEVELEIEHEIESLKTDRRQLEFHIERTEVWSEHVGKWLTHIYNAEVIQEEDKMIPYFVIVVHLSGTSLQQSTHQNTTHGWIVSRNLHDFHALNEKLVQIGPWLKKKDLPTVSKLWFKSIDTAFLNKAKALLEDYLSVVMKDERMAQSEPVYAFLSPSPQHLKQSHLSGTKVSFSVINLLKSLPTRGQHEADSEDEFVFLDDESGKDGQGKDSVAEPLYGLIGEVFELKGVFKWLRRTMIAFVQVSFGRSINKQVREMTEWIFSEPMLIYYITTFRDSWWPNGELATVPPSRSDEEKMKTRIMAKEKILQNIPEALKNLLGEQACRRGAIKMFESLQDVRLNKHLVYVLIELLLYELCPELKDLQETLNTTDWQSTAPPRFEEENFETSLPDVAANNREGSPEIPQH